MDYSRGDGQIVREREREEGGEGKKKEKLYIITKGNITNAHHTT